MVSFPSAMRAALLLASAGNGMAHECPRGFETHGSSCYAFGEGPSTKTAASELCESFKASLACPTTQAEIDFLSRRAAQDGRDYWIGLSDQLHEGQWLWPGLCSLKQAANLSYPWCPGEPNDSGDCVRIVGTDGPDGHCARGSWADFGCERDEGDHGVQGERNGLGFVCEINFEKFAQFDDDDDEPASSMDTPERGEPCEGGGVATAFAWLFALAFAASAAGNVWLYSKWKDATAKAAAQITAAPSSAYRAPLRQPGEMNSSLAIPA